MKQQVICIATMIFFLFNISICSKVSSPVSEENTSPLLLKNEDYFLLLTTPYSGGEFQSISPFSFLSKTGEDSDCFKEDEVKPQEFLHSSEFYAFAKNFNPQDFKGDLNVYLTQLILMETEKIRDYYSKNKARILESYDKHSEEVKQTLDEGFKRELVYVFKNIFETNKCEASLERVRKIREQLEKSLIDIDFLLDHDNHDFSSLFYSNLFLNKSECKNNVFSTLFKEPVSKTYNSGIQVLGEPYPEAFSKNLYSFAKLYNNVQTEDLQGYVKYIDWFNLYGPLSHNINNYFLDPRYFNLRKFEPLFALYHDQFIQEFTDLYDLIVDFRIKNSGAIKTMSLQAIARNLEHVLDEDAQKNNGKNSFINKLQLAYFSYIQGHDVTSDHFNLYNIEYEKVRLFIRLNPEIKPFAKLVDKKFKLGLEINDFEDTILTEDNQSLPKKLGQFFNDPSLAKQLLSEEEPSVRRFLEKLKSSSDENDRNLSDSLSDSLLKFIAETQTVASLEESADIKDRIFSTLLKFNQMSARSALRRILELVDDEKGTYVFAFDKFIEFINSKVIDSNLKKLSSSLAEANLLAICSELNMDIQTFKELPFDVCQGKEYPQLEFAEKFTYQFNKFISFVRAFQFYKKVTAVNANYFHFYKLILINRSKMPLGSSSQDYILSLDKTMVSILDDSSDLKQERKQLKNVELVHDLVRIINMSSFFNNPLIDFTVDITSIEMKNIYFQHIPQILKFYKESDKALFMQLLKNIYNRVSDKHNHYHYNNIFMLVEFFNFSEAEELPREEVTLKVDDIFQKVNNFGNTLDHIPTLKMDINVSKVEALFYFTEYLIREKRNLNDLFENFLHQQIHSLSENDKLLFFARNLQANSDLGIFSNIQGLKKPYDQAAVISTNKGKFVEHFFEKFTKIDDSNDLKKSIQKQELFAHIVFDYFFLLYEKNFVDQIFELKLWEYMIPYVIGLHSRKRVNNYREFASKVYDLVNQNDFEKNDDIYLINHYIFCKGISALNDEKKTGYSDNEFKEKFDEFVNNFYKNYAQNFKQHINSDNNSSISYNIQNFYLVHKITFMRIFNMSPSKDESLIELDRLSIPAASAYLEQSTDSKNYLADISSETQPKWIIDVKGFYNQNTKKSHQFENFFKKEASEVFGVSCRYEEFNMYIRLKLVNSNFDYLKKIISNCVNHPENFVNSEQVHLNEREAYKLLKSLTVFIEDENALPLDQNLNLKKSQLFELIWDKVKNKISESALIGLVKMINLKDKNYVVETSYVEFVLNTLRIIDIEELNKYYDASVEKGLVASQLKQDIVNHLLKDFFSFYKPNEYKLNVRDLQGSQVYEIATIRSEAILPLTRLAAGLKIHYAGEVSYILPIYFVAAQFRALKISGANNDPVQYINNRQSFNTDFENYINDLMKSANDKEAHAVLMYLKLAHFTNNVRRMEDFNDDKTFNCELINHLKYISEADNLDDVDIDLFMKLVNFNESFKSNIETYNTKALELAGLKTLFNSINSKFSSCQSLVKNNYANILANWQKFIAKILKNDALKKTENYFNTSKAIVHISQPVNAFIKSPEINLL